MTDDLILITGASGRTGRRMIDRLLKRGRSVRAFVRRAEAAEDLKAAGVAETIIGNLDADADLARAVAGATQILHISPPMHEREDVVARDMIRHAATSGCRLFALYSVLHPVIDVPHHRRKLDAEHALIDSGLPYVILQPSRYMQHLTAIWPQVRDHGIHRMPFSTASRFSLVDLEDLADATARVLCEPGHAYATYQLAGPERLSMDDCAARLGTLLGKPVTAQEQSLDEMKAQARARGVGAERLANMAIMNAHYTAHGLQGNPNVLRMLLGREPNKYEDFVRRDLL
jgi:uncharacterized protein YbjT (DUF2867 family)